MTEAEVPLVAGRSCGRCTLCCKVPQIDALQKPLGKWCVHCDIGRGCRIHGEHPQACREFFCGYLTSIDLGEHWRPSDSKMIVTFKNQRIVVSVDQGAPDAWRKPPFRDEMKFWARHGASQALAGAPMTQVLVLIGKRVIVVLPDRDVDLGVLGPDDRILVDARKTPKGLQIEAAKAHKDDPRLSHVFASRPVAEMGSL